MADKLGKEAIRWPQALIVLLAFVCFLVPGQVAAQGAVDRGQATAVANYVVQPGDVLSVLIWGWPEASDKQEGRFPVEANGRVFLPVVGAVEVAGKTAERVQAELRQRLASEQRQAVIVIEPLFAVAVNGEVRQPNVYDFKPGQTAFDALARAGGYTQDADRVQLLLVRDGSSQTLSASTANELAAQLAQTQLKSGDRILVHPKKRVAVATWLNVLQTAVAAVTLYTLIANE
jgi:protein involved in polysaccharide export with SLBB domain